MKYRSRRELLGGEVELDATAMGGVSGGVQREVADGEDRIGLLAVSRRNSVRTRAWSSRSANGFTR